MHTCVKIAVGTALLAGACNVSGDEPVKVARDEAALTANGNTLWEDPYVVVCWENPGFATEKDWVRNAVETSWMRNSRLVFSGWNMCTGGESGIHIHLENGAAPAGADPMYGWGRVDGLPAGGNGRRDMYLSFDFVAKAADFPSCTASAADTERCIRSIAVHEFGHTLGYAHEQDRYQADISCVSAVGNDYDGAGRGVPNEQRLGPFDDFSIMSYCTRVFNNNGILSPNDAFYTAELYGHKAAGELVSFDGRCLDFSGGDTNESLAQTYECLGGTHFAPGDVASDNQRVYFSPTDSRIGVYSSNRVLDVPRNDSTDGNRVQLFDSLGTPGQQWHMRNAMLRGMGGMCVSPVSASPGSELALERCDDIANPDADQVFELRDNGQIFHKASNQCLDSAGIAAPRLFLGACSAAASQRWTLSENGSIRANGVGAAIVCVDVGLPDNDLNNFYGIDGRNRLQAYPCNGQSNQRFSVAGPVEGIDGKCLDVANFEEHNGTSVQVWTCNGEVNQVWELHW